MNRARPGGRTPWLAAALARLGALAVFVALAPAAMAAGAPPVASPTPIRDGLLNLLGQFWSWLQPLLTLNQMLLCCWSGLLLFAWMVRRKYRDTAPNYGVCLVFLLAGVGASLFALTFNNVLAQETAFSFFDCDTAGQAFMSFFIGAGLGEEFWKMAAGLMVVLGLASLQIRIGDAGRILGFVVVGLGFATMENFITYSNDLTLSAMLRRGLLAVPVHATAGMIQAIAVSHALRAAASPVTPRRFWSRWRFPAILWPLALGYFIAVAMHTLYDTLGIILDAALSPLGMEEVWPDFIVSIPSEFTVGPLVALMFAWFLRTWEQVPELGAEPGLEAHDGEW